jgi:hypothetical protein
MSPLKVGTGRIGRSRQKLETTGNSFKAANFPFSEATLIVEPGVRRSAAKPSSAKRS